jgi:hypothetical protein
MNPNDVQIHPIWGVCQGSPDDRIGACGPPPRRLGYRKDSDMRGAGRVVFAAILLIMVGVINIVYGIGALDDANYFVNNTRFVLDDLNTLGWVLLIIGIIQLTAGFSLMGGRSYGRVLGIASGILGAFSALFSIGGSNPWWSLLVFVLCIYIVHGIVVFGDDEAAAGIAE